MEYSSHRIAEWEKAIKHRPEICFEEIYLKDGLVEVVIGTVLVPTKRKRKGVICKRARRVRWNRYGICFTINNIPMVDLFSYNIKFT